MSLRYLNQIDQDRRWSIGTITLRRSEAGYVTRHRLPLGGRNRLHDFHHVGIVGPLTFGKAAHRLDQIFVTLAGQPRRRQAANEVLLMTNLAYSHSGGRRRGGGGERAAPASSFSRNKPLRPPALPA